MALAALPGESLWLDALSTDQTGPHNVASQVAVIGDIYSNTKCVAMLFPSSDEEAFEILARISYAASCITKRPIEFTQNASKPGSANLSAICQNFCTLIDTLESPIHKSSYFTLAWAFQSSILLL
jgi:hypothetical protein